MHILIAIVGSIFALFCVVMIHELGHFIVARLVGIRVLRFSIGFGKPIWSKTCSRGTEFALGWLPLGGYVRMLGEGDEAPPKDLEQFSYNQKSVFQRMAVVLAGPLMNFILAMLLYWILFLPGISHIKPVVGNIRPHSVAAIAGLKPMDQVIAIGNKPVRNWRDVIMEFIARMGEPTVVMTVSNFTKQNNRSVILPMSQLSLDNQKPEFLKALGIVPYHPQFPMKIGPVISHSPAAVAGLQQGDQLIAVDGKKYDDMIAVIQLIQKNPNKVLSLTVLRQGKLKNIRLKVGAKESHGRLVGQVGFKVIFPQWPSSMKQMEYYTVLSAWKPAIKETFSLIQFNGIVLGKMLAGNISFHALGGPISIFQMAGQASQESYRVYLGFLAFLSVALGFVNLLPIPGLDGGHFLFQVIESIFRRPVPLRIQVISLRFGFLLLVLLILSATFNDITRLFS